MNSRQTASSALQTFPRVIVVLAGLLTCGLPPAAIASQVPVPNITGSATQFSTTFAATNLFAPGKGEYASKGQGACTVPLTTSATNGTWVEMDFGSNVTFDRFILATRQDTTDVVGSNVLYLGTNAVHSTNDPYIFTFSTAGSDSSGPIRNLGSVSGRYARWEVLSSLGTTKNLGGRHMWFLTTPSDSVVLAAPTAITNTLAPVFTTAPYSTTFPATGLTDGNCGNGVSPTITYEYAEKQSVSGLPVIVLDFTTTNNISGFDYLNREDDLISAFNLIFSDDPTFTDNIATNSWNANATNGNVWTTGEFSTITARYVQLQATATLLTIAGTPNPGGREIIFYGPSNQPPGIVQQPAASENVRNGVFNLSVIAAANSLAISYQWQLNGTNLTDGPSISGTGATVSGSATSSLTVSNAAPLDSGNYTVILSNSLGVVTSAVSAVSVFSAPVILAQPNPTNLLLYAGQNVSLSLTAFGSLPISYSWYSNSTLVAVGTNATYTFDNVQANSSYYSLVSNAYGSATSSVVSVTVLPKPAFPYPLAVLHDHPIAYWPLNEVPDNGSGNNGTIAYDYAGGYNGVYTSTDLGLQGYGPGLAAEYGYAPPTDTNSAAEFGAFATTNSFVGQIPTNLDFTTPPGINAEFSVEAWVSLNGNNGGGIVAKGYGGGGEEFGLDTGTTAHQFRFFVRNAAGTAINANSTIVPVDNLWYHLVGVCDEANSNVLLYVNGVQAGTAAIASLAGIVSDSPVNMTIGSRSLNATSGETVQSFGEINEVAVYNYALAATQVANHYYAAGIGPNILVQPASFTNVDEGTTLTIPVAVNGTLPLVYQWYDVTSGTPGTALAGQTNASLVISNIIASTYNGHFFDLTVTNIYGQATSGEIQVQVQAGPPNTLAITPNNISVYAGFPATFTVTAQGTEPFTYQWSTNGVNIPTATNAVYTNVAVPGANAIVCAVSNSVVSGPAPTATASITGIPAPTDGYGLTVLADRPIAYWRLDEPANASTANDYVGGHDATYFNVTNGLPGFRPLTIPSETATGFGMNGIVNDSVAVENDNTGNGIPFIDFSTQGTNAEFSVEAWVNAPARQNTAGAGIVAKGYGGGGEQFGLDSDTTTPGSFRFFVRTGAGTAVDDASGFALDGNWHHVVGVCDQANGNLLIYVDGALQATAPFPEGAGVLSTESSSFPVSIGSRALSSVDSGYFDQLTNAVMNDVAIYGYALSSSQVAAHYAAAPASIPVSLTIQVSGNNMAVISWPTNAVGYVLQQVPALSSTNWLTVTNATNVVGGQNQVMIAPTNVAQFYRLMLQ